MTDPNEVRNPRYAGATVGDLVRGLTRPRKPKPEIPPKGQEKRLSLMRVASCSKGAAIGSPDLARKRAHAVSGAGVTRQSPSRAIAGAPTHEKEGSHE